MFNKIWKDQIVKPKGKLGIWKPKEELRPREEEKDDKCCEEAREYYIRNVVGTTYNINIRHIPGVLPKKQAYNQTEEQWWVSNKRWAENCDEFIKNIRTWRFLYGFHFPVNKTLEMYDECMGK